ncbi:MAG: cytochrome b/b6 domain-containing protein [Gammaproteobacteria bacterium]|nr:cytochrome b/b6 domain-containing protein [Gammaproteobacteria bacterium]
MPAMKGPETIQQTKHPADGQLPGASVIWDLPTRLFHWILALAFGTSVYTGYTGGFTQMEIHLASGQLILWLVTFRLIWGFVGHYWSRFSSFLSGPSAIKTYLRHLATGEGSQPAPGHNPLGGLSVIAMLTLLAIQAVTGLFSNDDIMTEGPLAHLISHEASRQLTEVHALCAALLMILVFLHLTAVFWYVFWRRHPLIRSMVTGRQTVSLPVAAPEYRLSWLRLVLALATATLLTYGLINWL